LPAGLRRFVARIPDEVLAADGAQQRVPHLLLHEDEDVVVRPARMAAIRGARHARPELIPGPPHGPAVALMVPQADAHQVHNRVLHGHLDLLTLSGRMALHEGGEDANHAVHAGAGIAMDGQT
jgi:hypothetical protein